jgi:hemoglobin
MNGPVPADETPYSALGGDAGVRRLVDAFYGLMDEVPEYHCIRKLHPRDLAGSREKLYLFLSDRLGGPPLYVEKYGHAPASSKQGSRLRDAHVRESGTSPL